MKESVNFIKYRKEKHFIKLLIIDLITISSVIFIIFFSIKTYFPARDESILNVISYAEDKLNQINIRANKLPELKIKFDSLLFDYNQLLTFEANKLSLINIYGILSDSIPTGVKVDSLVMDEFQKDSDYIILKGTSENMNKLMEFSKNISNESKKKNFQSKLVMFENKLDSNDVYYEIIIEIPDEKAPRNEDELI